MQKATSFNDVAKESDYRINFWYMSKDDAINIMKNFDLNENKWSIINIFRNVKMSEITTYYWRNKKKILNRARDYMKRTKKD